MCSIITIVIKFLMSFTTITVVLDFVAAAVVVADVGLLLLLLFPLLLLLLLFLPCFVCSYPHGHCTCQELSTIKVNVPSFYGRHQWCKKVQKFL